MRGKPFTLVCDGKAYAYRIKGNRRYSWCWSDFEDATEIYLGEGEELRVRARVVRTDAVRRYDTMPGKLHLHTIWAMRAIRRGRSVEIGMVEDSRFVEETFVRLTVVSYKTWKLYTGKELETGQGVWFVLTSGRLEAVRPSKRNR